MTSKLTILHNMKKAASKKLDEISNHAYKLFMSDKMKNICIEHQRDIELAIIEQKKNILFCEIALRDIYN